jgi:hypothetical protein
MTVEGGNAAALSGQQPAQQGLASPSCDAQFDAVEPGVVGEADRGGVRVDQPDRPFAPPKLSDETERLAVGEIAPLR